MPTKRMPDTELYGPRKSVISQATSHPQPATSHQSETKNRAQPLSCYFLFLFAPKLLTGQRSCARSTTTKTAILNSAQPRMLCEPPHIQNA
jgi:hypothetical protein